MEPIIVSEHWLSDEVLAQLVRDEQRGARMLVLSQDGVYRMTLTLSEAGVLAGLVEGLGLVRKGAQQG